MTFKWPILWPLSLFSNNVHRKPQAFGIGLLGLTLSMGLVQSAQADNRLGGISTRSFVQTESANYMIAGVFINGGSKRVVVRASSVDGVLDPLLEVQSYPDGNLLYSNDNWATDPSAAELQQTGWAPNGTSDAAMIITLSPGLYTMQVSPVDKPGVGLIEVYELNSTESPKLGGISTRSFVQTDSMNYMIAGLFISGSAKRVVVRAASVDGVLDPQLEVQSYPEGNLLYSNDNWGTDPSAAELQQTGWAPARSLDAAMIITLSSGLYTMQVSPKSSPGIGLIEVYELPEEPDGPKYSSTPVPGSTLDFGNTPVGTPVSYDLVIGEEGNADLVLNSSSISGTNAKDFRVLTAFPLTLPDNAVYIQAPTVTIQCTPSDENLRTTNLQINSNDGTHSYLLQCTGIKKGEPRYYSFPEPSNVLDFGNSPVGTPTIQSLTIAETGDENMIINFITVSGIHASDFRVLTPYPITIADGGSPQLVSVQCIPSVESVRTANLQVSTNDPTQPPIITYPVQCTGCCVPKPEFSSVPEPTNILDFGNILVNSPTTRYISIKNSGDADLSMNYSGIVGSHANDFSILSPLPLTVAGGTTKIMTVQCNPSAQGQRLANLQLNSNAPKQPSFIIYPLQCTGVAQVAGFYSSHDQSKPLDFGTSIQNIPVTQSFIVKETGNADLKLNFSLTNNSEFEMITSTSISIPDGGDELLVTLKCTPSNVGIRQGKLQISTNDPTQLPLISYLLQCKGDIACTPDFPGTEDRTGVFGSLGLGQDSDRDRFKPASCLNGSNTTVGAGESYLDGTISYTYEELKKDLKLKADGKIRLGLFKLDAKTEFALSTKDSSQSRSIIFKFVVHLPNGKFVVDGTDVLNALGKSVYGNSCKFRNVCGDKFIEQTERGANLYVAMTFDFDTHERKEQFFAELGVSYGGFGSLKASLNKVSQETRKNGNLTIRAYQMGGDVTELPKLFGASPDTIAPAIKCSLGTLDECDKAMNQLLIYASNEFAQGAKTTPETLGYHYANYAEVGVNQPLEPGLTAAIIEARKRLAQEYETQFNDNERIKAKRRELETLLTDPDKQLLTQMETDIDVNLAILRNAARWCFSDLSSCLGKKEDAFNSLISYDRDLVDRLKLVSEERSVDVNIPRTTNLIATQETHVCLPSNCELDYSRTHTDSNGVSGNVGGPGYGVFVSSVGFHTGWKPSGARAVHSLNKKDSSWCLDSGIVVMGMNLPFFTKKYAWYQGHNVIDGKCLEPLSQ